MPKENKEITPKIITKKHIARLEKEDRQKKFLLLGLIALLVIVVALVTYGILDNTVLKTKKPVARVNSSVITVEQFQKRVKYERLSLSETFVNYASSQFAQFFQSQLLEVQNKLDDYIQFGSDTLDKMIDEELVAQKAKELGITVSEEEIDKEIERSFGFFPNGTPTPIATVEYKATSTYSPTQLALVTLTPTPTEFPTETPFPLTPTVAITLSGTESAGTPTATEIPPTSTPEVQPTATEIPPTPTEYTRAGFESLYETMVANVGIQTDYNSADFRAFVKNILLSTKVYDYLTKDLKPAQEMVWARQILVQTEPEAKLMLTKLNSGEDWTSVAANFSKDLTTSATGGDLGWFAKGSKAAEIEAAAFSLKIGEISEPIKTDTGYYIIQVLGHEIHQLTEEELTAQKGKIYSDFVNAAKTAATIKKYDVWASVVPNTPAIPTELRIAQ